MSMTFLILLVAFFVAVNHRRRRWNRGWGEGSRHFPPQGGPPWTRQQVSTPERADLESYVDSLESRVAQLEERLDFTERLLTGSKGPVDWRAEAASREKAGLAEDDEPRGLKGNA
jgi:hypothetical protein